MVANGIVAKQETNETKSVKKRTARQANLDISTTTEIKPKRTKRQEAIHLAAKNKLELA